MIVVAIGCGGGSAPASPSRAAVESPAGIVTVTSSAPALFGASAVDFARCLQGAQDPGCFAVTRIQPRAVGAAATAASAPTNLLSSSSGDTVTLTWGAPASGDAVTSYIIEAGSAPGLANLANVPTNSSGTAFSASGIGGGTYYVRVRAQNTGGTSAASNESILVVGSTGCVTAPNAAANLATTVSGSTVTLTWSPPAGGCAPSSYVLQAGSSAGSSDLANANVGAATSYVAGGVGAGTYYIRVRAMNAYGQSGGSNEVVIVVTSGVPAPVPGGVGGTWLGLAPDGMVTVAGCPRDVNDVQLVVTQTGNNITGTWTTRIRESFYPPDVGKSETASLTGTVSGNAFSFSIIILVPIGGGGPIQGAASGTFTSTRMTGTINTVPPSVCNGATFVLNRP
jgi:hypothetical protein